ncbi:MAG: glycosyltransferase [Burkholderiales bacterium]|nr:glycosyltransferase [Burkholderiales bacterium]
MSPTSHLRLLAIVLAESVTLAFLVLFSPLRLLRRILAPGTFQTLWTGTPIITMALKARAERSLGFRSRSLVTHSYYITDAFDVDLSALRSLPVVGYIVPFAVFFWACLFVDRLHFYCDRGILPTASRGGFNWAEFLAYRALRIQIVLWTYGSDVRTRSLTLALGTPNCCTECPDVAHACICDQRMHSMRFNRMAREALAVFSMGDMIEYTPGSRNDLFFWPLDLDAEGGERYRPAYPHPQHGAPLRVVHAPNHAAFKGTRYLHAAIDELRREGVAIELVTVEKVPNREALDIYRSADVIFDQCMIGFHGYFALEGMALGKPVMCFIRKPTDYLLHPEECPIINTHISTLKEDLRQLSLARDGLADIGRRGRSYVEKHFSTDAFAQRLREAYMDLGIMS